MKIVHLGDYKENKSNLLSPVEKDYGKIAAPGTERIYAGARVSRLDTDLGEINEINRSLYENLLIMRGRSRQLAIDNVHVTKFLKIAAQETLGPKGLKLSVRGPKEDVNKLIEELYNDWSEPENCCTMGDTSLLELEELAVTTRHQDGEFFCRIVENFNHNKYRFALFPFDADRIELGFDRMPRPDGSYIRNAIEYDQWGRPTAYYILTRHPGENVAHWPDGHYRIRIPAAEIAHYYELFRPGQGRGIPSVHSAITTTKHLSAYIKATIVAARVISSKFAAITQKDVDPYNNPNAGKPNDDTGEIINKAEPGRIFRLRPGEALDIFDPKQPSGVFGPFVTTILQGTAAGLGVSYASLSGDLSKTSYASGRLGALEMQDHWTLKRTKFIKRFKVRIYRKWLTWAYLTQDRLFNAVSAKELEMYRNNVYVYDKPEVWVDPATTAKVIDTKLKNRTTTILAELSKQGIDYDSHMKQLEKEAHDLVKINKILTDGGVTKDVKKEQLNVVKNKQNVA